MAIFPPQGTVENEPTLLSYWPWEGSVFLAVFVVRVSLKVVNGGFQFTEYANN